jgi:preprotein translocase subunit SecA
MAAAAAQGGAGAADVAAATATAPQPTRAAATPANQDPTTGTVHKDDRDKIGRNDPCWCGSGKKYKKCHGA